MIQKLGKIYDYAQLIPAFKEIIENCYNGGDIHVRNDWEKISDLVLSFCKEVSEYDSLLGQKIYSAISKACKFSNGKNCNYILMGDGLESALPYMMEGIKCFGQFLVSQNDFRLFSSESGFVSLEYVKEGKILNSTKDPMWEALNIARKIYRNRFTEFRLLGACQGYLAWQLFVLSDCSLDIKVYCQSKEEAMYACMYGVLDWIPEEKLTIIIEEDSKSLFEAFTEGNFNGENQGDTGFYVTESGGLFMDAETMSLLSMFCAKNHTGSVWGRLLSINAYRNQKNVKNLIADFKPANKSNTFICVAAGPSLDDTLEYIKESVGKKTVLCASTVLKKLLDYGIVPDGVAVLDPQERTFGHFDKLSNDKIPLLLNVTANWRFGEIYKGPKYLVPSLTDEETVKNFLLKGVDSLYLGSTVASMLIKLAVFLGAEEVELAGIDLAYPGGKSHASQTMDQKNIDTLNLPKVEDVNGKMVATTRQFMVYIAEIEGLIRENAGVKFINLSSCGAKFKGTVERGK